MITLELTKDEGWVTAAALASLMDQAMPMLSREQRDRMIPWAEKLVKRSMEGAMHGIDIDAMVTAMLKLAPQVVRENEDV